MTIQVKVGDNFQRNTVLVDGANTTLAEAIQQAGFDPCTGSFNLDGMSVGVTDFDKTFDEFGIEGGATCSLVRVAKTQNA